MTSPSESNPLPDPKAAQRLHQTGLFGLVLACGWAFFKTGGDLTFQAIAAIGIMIFATLPALRWAKLQRRWFPVFEIACLIYVTFYAVPLLTKHSELAPYRPEVVTESAWLLLAFLVAANIGFESFRVTSKPPAWATVSLLPDKFYSYLPVAQTLNTIYIYVSSFTTSIPYDYQGTLRALFFGLGTISIFILSREAGLGRLTRPVMGVFLLNLAVQIIFLFSQLYLIGGLSLLILALIAYASASRRVPWLACGLMIPLIAFLHLGKPAMRANYWQGGKPLPGIVELPSFFAEWADYSTQALRGEESDQVAPSNLFERASLIQMLCLSVDRIPSLKPFMGGETYIDIPAQFIPRFIWPSKPSGLQSNIRLAVYFNLVSTGEETNVSIAFGIVAEAYTNFGYVGIIVLGLAMGMLGRLVSVLSESATLFSALGILMILLTAWSFQIEQVLATWVGSLFQASALCIGMPLIYRRFTHA